MLEPVREEMTVEPTLEPPIEEPPIDDPIDDEPAFDVEEPVLEREEP